MPIHYDIRPGILLEIPDGAEFLAQEDLDKARETYAKAEEQGKDLDRSVTQIAAKLGATVVYGARQDVPSSVAIPVDEFERYQAIEQRLAELEKKVSTNG